MDFRHPLRTVSPTLDGDVLSVLAGAEDEFSGRRIQRMLGYGSEPGVRKAADRLVREGIVEKRHAGRANLYSLNRAHVAAPHIEGLASLRAQLIKRLHGLVAGWASPPVSALLFGSVARGEAAPESDLDVLVVRPAGIDEDEREWREQLLGLERDATAWTGNQARVIEYDVAELTDSAVRSLVEEALRDGVGLYGSRRQLRLLLDRSAS